MSLHGDDRDMRAVALAESWWPGRYVGDLTTAEWKRVYEALDVTGRDEQPPRGAAPADDLPSPTAAPDGPPPADEAA